MLLHLSGEEGCCGSGLKCFGFLLVLMCYGYLYKMIVVGSWLLLFVITLVLRFDYGSGLLLLVGWLEFLVVFV